MSFLSYNIEGVSRLYDPELRNYLSSFDFCLLIETFTTSFLSGPMWFPDHDVFIAPAIRLSNAVTARLCGGLILLVKKSLVNKIEKIHHEFDNLIMLKLNKELLNTRAPVILVGVYLPPSSSPYYQDTELSNGVSLLENCLLDVQEEMSDVLIMVMGDLNARTDQCNAKDIDIEDLALDNMKNGAQELNTTMTNYKRVSKDHMVNDFGKYLLNVCDDFGLVILNGFAGDAESSGNYTYISPSGCSVIDYFILSEELIEHDLCMQVGKMIESKHMPIELIMNSFCLHRPDNVNPCKEFKYEKYQWDESTAEEFLRESRTLETKEMLDEAIQMIDLDINAALNKFNECIFKAGKCMKKTIYMGKGKYQTWFDKECRVAKKSLRKLLRKFHDRNTDQDRTEYNNKRREYKELLRNKKVAYRTKTLNYIQENIQNSSGFWGTIKKYSGKKVANNSIGPQDWFNHFKSLFNENDDNSDESTEAGGLEMDDDGTNSNLNLDNLEGDIKEEEVKAALRALKINKAAGPDGMIGEFLKYCSDNILFVTFLTKYCNKLFSTGIYPESWSESLIQPLHKKGDVNDADNYRGISLLNITSKLYSFILNKRLTTWIEENGIIGESQAGFRKTYSTIDHVFTMFAIIQRQLLFHKKLYVAFIDFKKAFDSVIREKLWAILHKRGIRNRSRMHRAIISMYSVVKARVRVGGDLTEFFMCPRGVKQGEVCSPVLFTLFIEELANEIRNRGRHGIQLFPDLTELFILLFADDIILLSDSTCGLQTQLNILQETANKLGLVVNLDKSNIVVFRNGGHLALNEKWWFGGNVMKVVNVYKYLGVLLSTRLSFSHGMNDAAKRAKKGIICILRLLWSLGDKSSDIFFKLFDCQIQPMLNYGCEIWGLSADIKIIEQVHVFGLKRYLNVSIRTPNVLVYGETGRYSLRINIAIKCIKYWLRVIKMQHHRLPFKAYKMMLYLHEQNKRTWASDVCFFLHEHGFQNVWENQGVGDENLFLKTLKDRLIDAFILDWTMKMRSKERYTFYSSLKSSFKISPILDTVKHIQARNYFIRMRLGVSQIKVHKLRYAVNVRYEDLLCPICGNDVETEVHFMLVCPAYETIREQYIPGKYFRTPSLFKLVMLMASESKSVMLNVANYVRHSFDLRNKVLTL